MRRIKHTCGLARDEHANIGVARQAHTGLAKGLSASASGRDGSTMRERCGLRLSSQRAQRAPRCACESCSGRLPGGSPAAILASGGQKHCKISNARRSGARILGVLLGATCSTHSSPQQIPTQHRAALPSPTLARPPPWKQRHPRGALATCAVSSSPSSDSSVFLLPLLQPSTRTDG